MSRVILIAADKPLPLCSKQEVRRKISLLPSGEKFVIDYEAGFKVDEHTYYQPAVDALGYTLKPFQYELEFECIEKDLLALQHYLQEHFSPGESLELWSIWVGDEPHPPLVRCSKTHKELDLAILDQLRYADQLCITITI